MRASRPLANWPQLVAVSLISVAAAGCSSDSGRFSDIFGASGPPPSNETTGSIQQQPSGRVESRPMPHIASTDGYSGGGRGMGNYQGDVTGTVSPPPRPAWTWEGGTPVTVGPGDTIESLARRHGVPVAAIMQANNIPSGTAVHPGQRLVIPRYRSSTAALSPPATRNAAAQAAPTTTGSISAPRTVLTPSSKVHVVAAGETLHSISRMYGKPVMALAKANNIAPDTMVKVGDRIIVPDVRTTAAAAPSPATPPAAGPNVANLESPHSARYAAPVAPPAQETPAKPTETANGQPSFRWPAHGHMIAGFGPKPNGLQNDGIDLAIPEGTPVKAAEDGVVAYAGSELKGYGNLVLVRHSNGFVTAYAHASEILVKRGETVKRGQVIARSGQTGNVTSPELHFEIRKGATPVDPTQYLNGA